MRLLILMVAVGFLAACNSAPDNSNEDSLSVSDSLLKQVLEGHDVAMPQMFKLERLQKEAQARIDSINKLPQNNTNKVYADQLETVVKKLKSADSAMHRWMDGFQYDSLKDNEPQREIYLQAQLRDVNEMKDRMLAGIAYADSVLAP